LAGGDGEGWNVGCGKEKTQVLLMGQISKHLKENLILSSK
jgi:hypothetical protein